MEEDALQRRSFRRTDDNEKPDSGEQRHHAKQFCDTNHRYVDENQSGRITARGIQRMRPTQDSPMPQWKAELDHLQRPQVLQMQLSSEGSGEFRDQQLQGRDDQCHWKMVAAEVLERSMHEGEDR
eukprot:16441003-Heterocapsa_arctica.AAC.1